MIVFHILGYAIGLGILALVGLFFYWWMEAKIAGTMKLLRPVGVADPKAWAWCALAFVVLSLIFTK